MRRTRVGLLLGILLLVLSLGCFAQSAPSPRQIEAHNRNAREFLKNHRPDLAIPEFRAIVALDPKNVDALGNLGVLLFFQGEYDHAIPPLRAALKLQPSLWKIQALLGMAEKRTGDYTSARTRLAKAFPKIEEEKIRIEAGMELIELYSGGDDLDKAAAIADDLNSRSPTNPEVLYAGYRIHSALAAQAMVSLTMVAPNSALMHQLMAHELAKRGELAKAIGQYREALQIDPRTPGLHFELAEMLNTSENASEREESEREYEAALDVNRFDERAACKLGDIAYSRGDLEAASTHYSNALELQPNDPDALVGLAKTFLSMNEPEKAQPLLEHAVAVDPTNAVAHFRLSAVYRRMGRAPDSKHQIEEYQKYKTMKEKLDQIYRAMGLQPSRGNEDAADRSEVQR